MSEQWGTDLTCNSVINSGPIIAILIYITAKVQSRPWPFLCHIVIFCAVFLLTKWWPLSFSHRILNVFCQSFYSKLDFPWIYLWKLIFLRWNLRIVFRLIFFFHSIYDLFDTVFPFINSYLAFYIILYHCISPGFLVRPSRKCFKMLKLQVVWDLNFLQIKTDIIMKQNLITHLVLSYIPNLKL